MGWEMNGQTFRYMIVFVAIFCSTVFGSAVVVPSNIVAYLPITLTNYQSSAVAANTPIAIGATNAFNSSMIGFDAAAYLRYETCSLNNAEFFLANGTIINSWLEGNMLSEGTYNAMCTSDSSANALADSANVLYWISYPWPSSFLPANTATATQNTIYMGWSGNTVSGSGNLLNGVFAGEAPQLSPSYGEYDDGANVFSYYNVNPSSTAGWTINGAAGLSRVIPVGEHFGAVNALYANSSSGDYMYSSVPGLGANEIISFEVYTSGLGDFFFLTNSTGSGQMARLDGRGGSDFSGLAQTTSWTVWNAPGTGLVETSGTWYKYDIVITGNTVTGYVGSVSNSLATLGEETNSEPSHNNGNYIGLVGDALGGQDLTYWDGIIARTYPPNGIMPGSTFGSAQYVAPALSLSNSTSPDSIDVVIGSPSDNALITATCAGSDTCQIWKVGGSSALATGTTTATLPYNALPAGYSGIYANDVTNGAASATDWVRRISFAHESAVTLANSQNAAVSADTQLMITFNALNFTEWESDSLNNTAIAFQNGTVAYSWIEGNVYNQQSAANTLYQASNVVIWFRSPNTDTFLAADTGTATSNTVIMGFDAPSNSLLDGNFVGEAPQLSFAYGEYDDGANVFSIYFNADTPISDFSMANGISMAHATSAFGSTSIDVLKYESQSTSTVIGIVYNSVSIPSGNYVAEASFQSSGSGTAFGIAGFGDTPIAGYSGSGNAIDIETQFNGCYVDGLWSDPTYHQGGTDCQGSATADWRQASITYIEGNAGFTGYIAPQLSSTEGGYTINVNANPVSSASGLYWLSGSDFAGSGAYINYNWARVRLYPPNGVMPTATFSPSNSFLAIPAITLLSPSNAVSGQSVTFAAYETGGAPPYTYNFMVYNSVTGALVANMLGASNTFSYAIPADGNSLVANVVVTDSEGYYANSVQSAAITVSSCPAASTVPANVFYAACMVLSNTNPVPYPANMQIMLPINSLIYRPYEAGSLGNIEFFYGNGTVINSWMEGNAFNESSAPSNTQTNTIYWLLISPANVFLPAYGANEVYMGFAPLSYSLLNQYSTGEAPQLSPTYGEYDNGANVFSFYDNFAGNSLGSTWSTTGSGTAAVNNGLAVSGTVSEGLNIDGQIAVASPAIVDMYVANWNATEASAYTDIRVGFSDTINSISNYDSRIDPSNPGPGQVGGPYYLSSSRGFTSIAASGVDNTKPFISTLIWPSTGYEEVQIDYGSLPGSTISGTDTQYPLPRLYYPTLIFGSNGASWYATIQWIRTRSYPPNGIMPLVGYEGVRNYTSSPSVSIAATPLPSLIAAGNTIAFNALVTAGAAPFAYTFQVYNTVTGAAINSLSTSSSSFVFATNSNLIGSTIAANVFVRDVLGRTANSVPTGTFAIVSPPPATNATTTVGQGGCGGGICGSGGSGAYGTTAPTTLPTTSVVTSSTTTTTVQATSVSTTAPTTTVLPITVKPIPLPGSVNATTVSVNASVDTPAIINFSSANATVKIYTVSHNSSRIDVRIQNLKKQVLVPPGAYVISAVNISSQQSLSYLIETISYPCGTPSSSIAPYELVNGAWVKASNYTVDAKSCTVSLTIPGSSAVVALIYGNLSQAQSSQYLIYTSIAVVCLLAGGIVAYAYTRRRIGRQGKGRVFR